VIAGSDHPGDERESRRAAGVELVGKAVRLEPLGTGHVPGLVLAASEDRSSYGYTRVPDGTGETRAYVEEAMTEARAGRHLPFAVVRIGETGGGRVVGTTRFCEMDPWAWPPGSPNRRSGVPDAVEIGHTWLAASAQRTVVNTEAKLLLLAHAFDAWDVHRVRLRTDARNARSRAAIERLGARLDGVLRCDIAGADGTVRDSAYFSIVTAEWPAVRARLSSFLARAT